MRTKSRRQAELFAGLLSIALLAGCGNRVDHDRVVAVGNGYGPVDAQRTNTAAGAGVTVPDPSAGQPALPSAVTASGVGQSAAQPVPSATAAAGSKPVSTSAQPGAGSAVTASAACAQPLSPIVLGQTLASSGLVGAAISGLRVGLAVWAKAVNAAGGVQCHPIQLVQLDDASDPARVSANWNTLVHDRGAVAILGGGAPIAMAAMRTAAERDKVPVIGGDIAALDWFQSPYLFPPGGAPLSSYDGAVIEATKAIGGTVKAGIFYCVEASICTGIKNNYPRSIERAHIAAGPVQAVSLTQPDFSAECQTMKAAGVSLLFLAVDGSASVRAARSCASLDYHPVIATGAIAVSAAAAADSGLRANTMWLGSGVVPSSTQDTPGVKEYHAAMDRFVPGAVQEQQTLLGWAAGKLFEAALTKAAAKARAGDVSTGLILEGLWQVKDEKLAGLGPGITFTKGEHATYVDCYYPLKLDANGFGAPLGSRTTCLSKGGAAPAAQLPQDRQNGVRR